MEVVGPGEFLSDKIRANDNTTHCYEAAASLMWE
jgi:hypothetical protein